MAEDKKLEVENTEEVNENIKEEENSNDEIDNDEIDNDVSSSPTLPLEKEVIKREKLGEEAQEELAHEDVLVEEKPKSNIFYIGTFFLSATAIALYWWFIKEENKNNMELNRQSNDTKTVQIDPLSHHLNKGEDNGNG